MHAEAYEGFGRMLELAGVNVDEVTTVLDIGGQSINGNVYDYFKPGTKVTTLDLENATIKADARRWVPDRTYGLVIATELFEHVEGWEHIIRTARLACDKTSVFITTCASTDRPRHGATGASLPAPGEWYQNVDPLQLGWALDLFFGQRWVEYNYPPGDAYAWARP